MTMTLHEPAPPGIPSWLAIGVRAQNTATGRLGIAQLFRDDLGDLNTDRPTGRPARVLLRPLAGGEPWWVNLSDLTQPADSPQADRPFP